VISKINTILKISRDSPPSSGWESIDKIIEEHNAKLRHLGVYVMRVVLPKDRKKDKAEIISAIEREEKARRAELELTETLYDRWFLVGFLKGIEECKRIVWQC